MFLNSMSVLFIQVCLSCWNNWAYANDPQFKIRCERCNAAPEKNVIFVFMSASDSSSNTTAKKPNHDRCVSWQCSFKLGLIFYFLWLCFQSYLYSLDIRSLPDMGLSNIFFQCLPWFSFKWHCIKRVNF